MKLILITQEMFVDIVKTDMDPGVTEGLVENTLVNGQLTSTMKIAMRGETSGFPGSRTREAQTWTPPPGDLPDPGMEPMSPASSALAGGFFTTALPEKPNYRHAVRLLLNPPATSPKPLPLPHHTASTAIRFRTEHQCSMATKPTQQPNTL